MAVKKVSPEKLVEADVLFWCLKNKWSVDVYDSKGSFSAAQKRYTKNKGMKSGTPDLIGCDDKGHAVFVELKTSKTVGSYRQDQAIFLHNKIESGAFCCVVDSAERLEFLYDCWINSEMKKQLLKSELPKKIIFK